MATDFNTDLKASKLTSDMTGDTVGTVSAMPTPTASLSGMAVVYMGADTTDYKKGMTYKCDGTAWTEATGLAARVTALEDMLNATY